MTRTYARSEDVIVIKQTSDPDIITQTRTYKLITPLFGGGAKTQKPDEVTTVRATEVRGHLRFWWRATRGGMFNGDLKKMKEEEERIWGAAAKNGKKGHSDVKINVLLKNKTKSIITKNVYKKKINKEVPVGIGEPDSPWGYVAFPLREQTDKKTKKVTPAGSVQDAGIEFELEIKYPDTLKKEIEPAIWAWETFGGIGARTRRGFGALQCIKENGSPVPAPNRKDVNESYLHKYLMTDGEWPAGIAHLKKVSKYKISKTEGKQIEIWEYLFKALQNFRQQRYGDKHGLSQWPEANEIRRLHDIEANLPKKEKLDDEDIVLVEKFPRAKFGLPVQFNMPHDKSLVEKKIELHGRKLGDKKYIDRLASPLIIRPIACIDDNKESAVGIAIVLEWEKIDTDETYTPPGGLILSSEVKGDFKASSKLENDEPENIKPLNLSGKPQPDVLQAFLDYLK